MPLGKCGGCGNHPRSKLHVELCANKVKVEPVDLFVIGSTCVGCNVTYSMTPFPPFQDPDAKRGHYDVTRQLPNCSTRYPICARCLPWYWRADASHLGTKKEVEQEYAGCFV